MYRMVIILISGIMIRLVFSGEIFILNFLSKFIMVDDNLFIKQIGMSVMWGGCFSFGQSDIMEVINVFIDIDQCMVEQDIQGFFVYVVMLGVIGIILSEDVVVIQCGLEQVCDEICVGGFLWFKVLEDVYMNVEVCFKEIIGELVGCLYIVCLCNDQVVMDFCFWLCDVCDCIDVGFVVYQYVLV